MLALTSSATADEEVEVQTEVRRADGISLTFSPYHVLIPMGELQLEIPLSQSRKSGLAIVGGYGSANVEIDGIDTPATIYDIGSSIRYYLFGDYSMGFQVGVEAMWTGISEEDSDVRFNAQGFTIGPFVGFKVVLPIGFTVDTQIGAAYITARGELNNPAEAERTDFIPLFNLNVGWTF